MEYTGYTPTEIKKDKRKNLVRIIVVILPILFGIMCLLAAVMNTNEINVDKISEVSYKGLNEGDGYYFEEMVVLDTYASYGDTTTGNVERNYFIVGFKDRDDTVVYASLQTIKGSEFNDKCEAYIEDDSMEMGDLVVSGCFNGYKNGETVHNYFMKAYDLFNQEMPGELVDWTFYYETETIEEYMEKEAKQPYFMFIFSAVFIIGPGIGLILLIRKRKELNGYLEEWNGTTIEL